MSTLETVSRITYDFDEYVYQCDPNFIAPISTAIHKKSNEQSAIDITVASLMLCKITVNATAYKIEVLLDLTKKLISHIESKNSVLSMIWQKALGAGHLNELHTLKTTFCSAKQKAEKSHEETLHSLEALKNPDLRLWIVTYTSASQTQRQTPSFEAAKNHILEKLPVFLSENAHNNFENIANHLFVIDPLIKWVRTFVDSNPTDTAILNIMTQLQSTLPQHGEPISTTEILAILLYNMYNAARPMHTTPGGQKIALDLADLLIEPARALIENRVSTFCWQEFSETISHKHTSIKVHDWLFFFLSELATICLKNRLLLSVLEEGLAFLSTKPESIDLMEKIHTLYSDDPCLDLFATALDKQHFASSDVSKTHKIMQRFWQIAAMSPDVGTLAKTQMLRIAYFIEVVLSDRCLFQNQHYCRKYSWIQKECPGLAISIEQDIATGAVTLLLPRKGSRFENKQGSIKKPREALFLPRNAANKPFVICRTVNTSFFNNRPVDDQIANELRQEAIFQESMQDIQGIWKLLNWCEYTTTKRGKLCHKISMHTELATHTMQRYMPPLQGSLCFSEFELIRKKFHEQMDKVPLRSLITIFKDLAKGLISLHENKKFHGDVKGENAFVLLSEQQVIKAGWSDFGHSQQKHELLRFYGTIDFTAPELINEKFKGSYSALDVWAFGCVLFMVLRRKDPSWMENVLTKVNRAQPSITSTDKGEITRLINEEIEKPREKLTAKQGIASSRKVEHRIDLLLYNCLRYSPEERWSMPKILSELEAISGLI